MDRSMSFAGAMTPSAFDDDISANEMPSCGESVNIKHYYMRLMNILFFFIQFYVFCRSFLIPL